MSEWHYLSNGRTLGPIDDGGLASRFATGEIHAETPVWRAGMEGWAAAREVPEAIALASGTVATGTPPRRAPPTSAAGIVEPPRPPEPGDATGGVIPYRNPLALTAYYLGIFALIPILGAALAVAAIVCGVLGLRARRRAPAIRGHVHAWIAIGLGTLVLLGHVVVGSLLLLAALGG